MYGYCIGNYPRGCEEARSGFGVEGKGSTGQAGSQSKVRLDESFGDGSGLDVSLRIMSMSLRWFSLNRFGDCALRRFRLRLSACRMALRGIACGPTGRDVADLVRDIEIRPPPEPAQPREKIAEHAPAEPPQAATQSKAQLRQLPQDTQLKYWHILVRAVAIDVDSGSGESEPLTMVSRNPRWKHRPLGMLAARGSGSGGAD
ncbi:hypothetical protein DFH09DRAFT_1080891 [Mycena vulgaris]|nr:hypothetical protein DFH09DRAFT_1080891 [Mycena vulgaris]